MWDGGGLASRVGLAGILRGVGRYGGSVPLLPTHQPNYLAKKNPASLDGATGYFSEHPKYSRLLAGGEFGLSLLPVRAVYRMPPHVPVLACPVMNTDSV